MTSEQIKDHWNDRALKHPESATTNDIYLRKLEELTLEKEIIKLRPASVLDLGAGDCLTTIALAKKFPKIKFIAMEFAERMLELASLHRAFEYDRGFELKNLETLNASVLTERLPKCDLTISCRCLINFTTHGEQYDLINRIKGHGRLLENFESTQIKFNDLRLQWGLDKIPIHSNNLFLWDGDYDRSVGFADTYYFMTRIVYASKCKRIGVEPDYKSVEHQEAVLMPNVASLMCAPMRMICL